MKVKFRPGIHVGLVNFSFSEDDYVTIVIRYWSSKENEDDLYYHGTITEIDEEREGFWAVLDDDPNKEEFFAFADVETVLYGDRIPFLGGSTKRRDN